MNVHRTDTAIEHLRAMQAYIAKNSPPYALRVVDRLRRRSQQIVESPLSGGAVPEFQLGQIREVLEGPYRSIHSIKPDQVDVLAVIHGAQEILGNK